MSVVACACFLLLCHPMSVPPAHHTPKCHLNMPAAVCGQSRWLLKKRMLVGTSFGQNSFWYLYFSMLLNLVVGCCVSLKTP
jgi:hypothetical protein